MLMWNWFIAGCLLIFALVGLNPTLVERHCPRCGNAMQARGRLELLTRRANWFIGWRTFRCTHCSHRQTALTVLSDARLVVHQTHRIS